MSGISRKKLSLRSIIYLTSCCLLASLLSDQKMSAEREQKLLRELKERDEKIARLEQENALLKQKVDLLVKRIFGASSEKLDARQLELLLEGSSPGKPCEPELVAEATRRSKEESTPSNTNSHK